MNHVDQVDEQVLENNRLALRLLKDEKFPECFKILRDTHEWLIKYGKKSNTNYSKNLAITLNNLGCYYRKLNKYTLALEYFYKVTELEAAHKTDNISKARTHMNICTVLSLLNKHKEGILHANIGLTLSLKAFSERIPFISPFERNQKTDNMLNTIAIGYYNMGVEYEYLAQLNKSLYYLQQGTGFAIEYLPTSHILTEKFRESIKDITHKIHQENELQRLREEEDRSAMSSISNNLDWRFSRDKENDPVKTRSSRPNAHSVSSAVNRIYLKKVPPLPNPTVYERRSGVGNIPSADRRLFSSLDSAIRTTPSPKLKIKTRGTSNKRGEELHTISIDDIAFRKNKNNHNREVRNFRTIELNEELLSHSLQESDLRPKLTNIIPRPKFKGKIKMFKSIGGEKEKKQRCVSPTGESESEYRKELEEIAQESESLDIEPRQPRITRSQVHSSLEVRKTGGKRTGHNYYARLRGGNRSISAAPPSPGPQYSPSPSPPPAHIRKMDRMKNMLNSLQGQINMIKKGDVTPYLNVNYKPTNKYPKLRRKLNKTALY